MNSSCCWRMDAGNNSMAACEIPSQSGVNIGPTLTLFLVGVAGNLLALLVLQKRRPSKTRTTLFYTLLTVLIATDLVAQLLSSSAPLAVYAMGSFNATSRRLRLTWAGGRAACQAHAVVMTVTALGEPLLVLCMSAERLLCLKQWHSFSQEQQHRRAGCCLLGLLGAVLLVACLPLMGLGSYRLQYPGTWCFVDSHSGRLSDRLFAAFLALWNLLMILLIVACNLWVIWRLLSVRRVRRALRLGSAAVSVNRPKCMRSMEVQLVVILIAITASFALCWSPLMIRLLLNSVLSDSDCAKDLSAVHLASINQILDPWLYILLRKSNFQRAWQLLGHLAACVSCRRYPAAQQQQHRLELLQQQMFLHRSQQLRVRRGAGHHHPGDELHPSKLNSSSNSAGGPHELPVFQTARVMKLLQYQQRREARCPLLESSPAQQLRAARSPSLPDLRGRRCSSGRLRVFSLQ